MKSLASVLAATMMMILSPSCKKVVGKGPIVTQLRSTPHFTSIAATFSGNVFVTQGAEFRVEVQAQQNIQDITLIQVVNNELVIKFRDRVYVPSHEDVTVNVTAPDINGLRVSGSGNLAVLGPLSTSNLRLGVSGSGNIVMPQLNADDVQGEVSGNGNISVLTGLTNTESLRVSGSGKIDMLNVQAAGVNTITSGSGDTRVKATQHLQVKISGSGSVFYKGNPVITSKISGSGNLVHVD